MTYVMSDLHGEYEKFLRMLEVIGFTDDDELYILGDVIDRGPESTALLTDLSMRANVYPLLGNHELMALYVLRRLCVEITEENAETQVDGTLLRAMALWQADGGDSTMRQFRALPPDDREALLEYLEEFEPYAELSVGGREFVLVHGGLPDFSPENPLDEYDPAAMVNERCDYTRRYYADKYLVTGHTPTLLIDRDCRGRIYRKSGHIAIDCGCAAGLAPGCIRLDDLAEFYLD